MICYKDRSYCGSVVEKHTCGREATEGLEKEAEDLLEFGKLYGSPSRVLAIMDLLREIRFRKIMLNTPTKKTK